MDAIVTYFEGLGLDFWQLLQTGGILLAGVLVVSLLSRFIFGKESILNNAASAAIGILFIYAVTVVCKSAGAQFDALLSPLPFVDIAEGQMRFFNFMEAEYTEICSQLLSMVILAFLVNLADGWLPRGKNIFSWVFFRCMTIVLALVLHLFVGGLFITYLPEGIVTYAPTILLALLVIMLLTGALKILVGIAISTVNPLVAALYTFFFANIVGKQITKAVLTTLLLAALVLCLNSAGIVVISVISSALIAYIPFVLVLTVLWYIVGRAL